MKYDLLNKTAMESKVPLGLMGLGFTPFFIMDVIIDPHSVITLFLENLESPMFMPIHSTMIKILISSQVTVWANGHLYCI